MPERCDCNSGAPAPKDACASLLLAQSADARQPLPDATRPAPTMIRCSSGSGLLAEAHVAGIFARPRTSTQPRKHYAAQWFSAAGAIRMPTPGCPISWAFLRGGACERHLGHA